MVNTEVSKNGFLEKNRAAMFLSKLPPRWLTGSTPVVHTNTAVVKWSKTRLS